MTIERSSAKVVVPASDLTLEPPLPHGDGSGAPPTPEQHVSTNSLRTNTY